MKTARLIAIALAGAAIAAPAVAQAAPAKPPSHLRLSGVDLAAANPKAKKQAKKGKKAKIRARSSWYYDGSLGRPGAVTVTTPINVIDVPMWTAWGTYYEKALMNNNGPTVSRSPASTGTQDIFIIYSGAAVQPTASGCQFSSATASTRLGAAYSAAQLPYLARVPNPPKGSVRVVEYIYWYAAGTSTTLGATAIVPHYTSDHVCYTRGCTAYAGFVQLG